MLRWRDGERGALVNVRLFGATAFDSCLYRGYLTRQLAIVYVVLTLLLMAFGISCVVRSRILRYGNSYHHNSDYTVH